jgi:hypothetical protein
MMKRIACNASQPGIGAGAPAATNSVLLIGRETVPTFFWGGASCQGKGLIIVLGLILMGDWRDSFDATR